MLSNKTELDRDLVINQINGLQKIAKKIPAWIDEKIIFPPKVSLEQASSQLTGQFKASLISGDRLMDATGGFGIDSFYFSDKFSEIHHFEIKEYLSQIVAHNFVILNKNNAKFFAQNSIDYLRDNAAHYDWIYLDPARRDNTKRKVFLLEDCQPDIAKYQNLLLDSAENILVKLSPIMDIKALLTELQNVQNIWVIAVKNEVKELLVHFGRKSMNSSLANIHALDLAIANEPLVSGFLSDYSVSTEEKNPQIYLYEPSKAILKANLQNKSANVFALGKIGQNSHFYTSEKYYENYPGRTFKILDKIKAKSKNLKKLLPDNKANIIARNYPLKASQLYAKFKIIPGGDKYLIATTVGSKDRSIFVCERLK